MPNDIGFDPSFFADLRNSEQNHFWFRVRRKWILDIIQSINICGSVKVLEVGCGTGNVSSFLASHGYFVTGCEYYKEALDMAWPGFGKVQGSAIDLPFADSSFDVVCFFDVIEHFDSELPLLKEACRVLKKDGTIMIAVPARNELWSNIDVVSFHKRRYSLKSVETLLQVSGFKPIAINYMFMLLYLPMKLLRKNQRQTQHSLRINKVINSIAGLIFDTERLASRVIKLPVGTSIIAVAKKRCNLC